MASAKVIILDLADTLTTAGRLHGDALKFLEGAKRTHRLVLISNSAQRDIDELLDDYHIHHLFDLVISANEFDMKKPDPRIINTSIALLKDKTGDSVIKENVVLVGDRPDTDIKAGNLAGIKTIRVRRGSYASVDPDFPEEEPKVEFRNLEEVADYLGILAIQPEVAPKITNKMITTPEMKKKVTVKKAVKAKPAKKKTAVKKRVAKKTSKPKKKGLFSSFV